MSVKTDRSSPNRRSVLFQGAALALPMVLNPFAAVAQNARAPKEGPIELTVGTGAGGSPDVVIRHVARVLNSTGIVERPLVVQNRTGGGWTVAANWVLGRPGDENTILTMAGPLWTTPITQGIRTVYDKVTPIAMFAQGDVAVGVQPDSGIENLGDLFARAARKDVPLLKVSGAQVGAVDHMVTGLLEKAGGVKLNYIPFDGGGTAKTAFLGKNSDIVIVSLYEAVPLIEDNKIKIVAVLSDERRDTAPFDTIPTGKEQGFDVTMDWGQAWGIAGPPDLDPAVAEWWENKISQMVQTEEWHELMQRNWFKTFYLDRKGAEKWFHDVNDRYIETLSNIGMAKPMVRQ